MIRVTIPAGAKNISISEKPDSHETPQGFIATEGSYQGTLNSRYNISEDKDKAEILLDIAKERGCFKAGNEPDYLKASALILDDFRKGRLGRIVKYRGDL